MENLAQFIDHTLLKPEATDEQIRQLCLEAKEHQFKTVCVNPSRVPLAAKELRGSGVGVCTVVGFPLGNTTIESKVFEAADAIEKGATEIDMVINVGKLKSGDEGHISKEVKAVVAACNQVPVKVILETALLTPEEIALASKISSESNAAFVKTSTGFSTRGASIEDVKIMKENISENVQIKASGGIRDYKTAKEYIDLSVTRLGTSSGVAIINGEKSNSNY